MKHFFSVALCFFFLFFSFSAHSQVQSYVRVPGGVRFRLHKGLMEIDVMAGDVIRVKYTSLDEFPDKHSLVVASDVPAASGLPAGPAFAVADDDAVIVLSTPILKVRVNRSSAAITYVSPTGGEILAEDGSEGKSMSPATVVGVAT